MKEQMIKALQSKLSKTKDAELQKSIQDKIKALNDNKIVSK